MPVEAAPIIPKVAKKVLPLHLEVLMIPKVAKEVKETFPIGATLPKRWERG